MMFIPSSALPLILILATSAAARAEEAAPAYDVYQVNLNARDCKVTTLVNGKAEEMLSGDGTHGLTSAISLSGSGRAKPYTITLKLSSLGKDPWVSLNVVGASEDQVVDTLARGNVLSLAWDAEAIRAAKKKVFTVRWLARWHKKADDKPAAGLSDRDREVLLTYGRNLLKMYQERNGAAFATELLPLAKTRAPAGTSEEEMKREVRQEFDKLFTDSALKPVDARQVELMPVREGKEYRLVVAGDPMIHIRRKSAGDAFEPIEICVALVDGKPQIVRIGD